MEAAQRPDYSQQADDPSLLGAYLVEKAARAQQARLAQGDLMVSASVLLLPPILAFALGWAGLWIMRGFRS